MHLPPLQLKTQTPEIPPEVALNGTIAPAGIHRKLKGAADCPPIGSGIAGDGGIAVDGSNNFVNGAKLPVDWPDPRGFIPAPPACERPAPRPQPAPIMSHTRIYHGQDAKFTERLATYYYLRDDARFGGWAAYLDRPSDFVRFCCYLHVTETLAARGGTGEARVVYRWPIRRYER